jgi:hypothetical protein
MTMFNHVVAKLPPEVVASVRDIPLAPPLNESYKTLKTRLVSSFAPSKWEQVSRLLHFPDLGDRRPTALMDAMLASLPTGASSNCELFQGIFLERMPDYIRLHLSLPIFETAHKMTIMADALWAGHVKSSSGGLPVSAMFPSRNNRSPDHRPSSPTADQPLSRTPGVSTHCRLHRKFGRDAPACHPPCSWRTLSPALCCHWQSWSL